MSSRHELNLQQAVHHGRPVYSRVHSRFASANTIPRSTCTAELLDNIRTEVMVKLIKPYTRIRIGFVAQELNILPAEVESLLITAILDGCARYYE